MKGTGPYRRPCRLRPLCLGKPIMVSVQGAPNPSDLPGGACASPVPLWIPNTTSLTWLLSPLVRPKDDEAIFQHVNDGLQSVDDILVFELPDLHTPSEMGVQQPTTHTQQQDRR